MIPDYQTLMLPLLKLTADGKEYRVNDLIEILANKFNLTDEEKAELLPSGQSFLFNNRVGWARTYLKKSGLIDAPKRGTIIITPRGKQVLDENPNEIDVKFLRRFSEFTEFINTKKEDSHEISFSSSQPAIDDLFKETPEEQIEVGYRKIRNGLEQEILSKLKSVHPSFFEKIVVELLVKMGYGGSIQDAGKAIGKSGDEGIDGIIKEDKLGLDVIYVQAKRWEGIVGRPELHKFVGALAGQGAKKGIFITTSSFTKEAKDYTPKNETKIVLIDGEKLAQYMIDYNLGVSIQNIYEIKKIDLDYFGEE
ncbi:restriction endonuclease [Ginsengibacter hankyongi]|uniref:Restriction endonuclease n=1 Tax=Ginsengibacter hankyongi TaxID=2607284 RepID=A0A5J5IKJ8_9BACT|nr:restriction endonuclease [Ginsengibacter hankyongi]KAA9041546.1 restriction endonuclease [Ginsengibacter hankyongi]